MQQAVPAQFPHRSLYGILADELLAVRVQPERQLQDRELGGMQDEDLRQDRLFDDLVLAGGRKLAPPDIVVVHGS